MSEKLMLLPSANFGNICLVRIPDDFEEHEAFRHATGVIARLEEQNPHCAAQDVYEALEDHGFQPVTFLLGPAVN